VRTARGAGRFAVVPRPLGVRAAGLRAGAALDRARVVGWEDLVPALRDRAPEPPRLDEDVLVLRDPGGEDVRVAMGPTYFTTTPVPRITEVRVAGGLTGEYGTLPLC
ncbi:MAG TPA: hypothetical protein VGE38_07345, partial [Nocardioides sp.]|uniref:hypothetical protein n=1 Tax=Nocardioides sp. TaxID=35761 RepID=UPI002ED88411